MYLSSQLYSTKHLNERERLVREAAEERFYAFVKLIAPHLILGRIHEYVCDWIQEKEERDGSGVHLLVLLPRGHLKSTLMWLFGAWRIIRRPWRTHLYASSSQDLANRQLTKIKEALTSDVVRHLWPGLVETNVNRRSLWRTSEINVDHWARKEQGVRDYTVRALSVGSNFTGDHYDEGILDDVIAPESDSDPWTEAGREASRRWYSMLSSVLNPDSSQFVVGTRYHGQDLYAAIMDIHEYIYNEQGDIIDEYPLFSSMIEVVESDGQFLWPRQKAENGQWEGFDNRVLSRIREKYRSQGQMTQFFAQYYQNPTDKGNPRINEGFQYYDKKDLMFEGGQWHLKGDKSAFIRRPLKVFGAVDLAVSVRETADYTAIVTIGVDPENYRYILDIDRFRSSSPFEIVERIFKAHAKWGFYKCRVEAVAAQAYLIDMIKREMIARNQRFILDAYRPPNDKSKQERILSTLEPLYKLQQVYHFRGGNCEELEKELHEQKPEHDDIADALASVMEIAFPPTGASLKSKKAERIVTHPRFGGMLGVR